MNDDNRISIEEQRALGVRRGNANFVPAQPAQQLPTVRRMTPEESTALAGMTQGSSHTPTTIQLPEFDNNTHTSHVRTNDGPVEQAKASLLYSLAYVIVAALAMGAFLILTNIADGDFVVFAGMEILGTCILSTFALGYNREQGLHHSATGLGHAELKTRVQVADRFAQVHEHQIDADKEIRLAELQMRRELGQAYLKQLEGPPK